MPRSLLASAALAALVPTAFAVATPYETVVTSCEELPKIEENNVTNSRGDQSGIERNDQYTYEYAYRVREKMHLVLENGQPHEFDRLSNKTRTFRGDSVSSVRNQAEVYRRSRKLFECAHGTTASTAPATPMVPAPPPMPPVTDDFE